MVGTAGEVGVCAVGWLGGAAWSAMGAVGFVAVVAGLVVVACVVGCWGGVAVPGG